MHMHIHICMCIIRSMFEALQFATVAINFEFAVMKTNLRSMEKYNNIIPVACSGTCLI